MPKSEIFEFRDERSPVSEYGGEHDGLHHDRHYSGTAQDRADMERMGKTQQLNRSFHSMATLGLTCVIMATWEGMFSNATFSLINGGRAGTVWTFLATWVFTIPVTASIAEMQSMAPTSGGQYHWVSEFAPPSIQRQLSYVSGWLSALGWQAFVAVAAFQAGTMILNCVEVAHPDIVQAPWQGTLFTIGIALVALLFNIFLAKRLPMFEDVVLLFHLIGFFCVLIPLWVLAPMAPASEVFGKFENNGGWASIGSACVVGQIAAGSGLLGVDSAAHMSEEARDASITIPRMMVGTVLINGALGLVSTITYAFVIQDVRTQIVDSTAAFPWINVFVVATGSSTGAIGMAAPIIIICFGMAVNSIAAASRQAWAFARDGGLPFPAWFTRVTQIDKVPLPLNAMLASMLTCIAFALLNLGGTEVFNSIIGLLSGAIGLTYAISVVILIWHVRRLGTHIVLYGETLPPARWSLGRWGVVCNAIGVVYQLFMVVISFFPIFRNVTPMTMNWGIVMFGGATILSISYYLISGWKVYRGPVVDVKRG